MFRSTKGSLVTLLMVAVPLSGCSGDYNIQLPNHYFVARVYSGAFFIVNPQNHGVTPSSHEGIALAVVGDTLLGEIDPPPDPTLDRLSKGFFVVDTRKGQSWINLSREQYLQTLHGIGVNSPPKLMLVDRFSTLRTLRTAG
jgi:hypothetical protein